MTDDHVLVNREQWDADADNWIEPGRKAWSTDEISWGSWSVPESDLRVLPNVDGLDVIELGCGTAYWSAWLARREAAVDEHRCQPRATVSDDRHPATASNAFDQGVQTFAADAVDLGRAEDGRRDGRGAVCCAAAQRLRAWR